MELNRKPFVLQDTNNINDNWKRIFDNLDSCGKILKWEVQFLRYNKNWSKEVYWQKLIEIVSSAPPRPSESKQILFCATILFVLSLQQYIKALNSKAQNDSPSLVLLELKEQPFLMSSKRRKTDPHNEPEILVQHPKTSEIATCLKVAVKCWQLANANEIIQFEFTKLIRTIQPISEWSHRFMMDLSLYLGRLDEVGAMMSGNEKIEMSPLERNLRLLGLAVQQSNINVSCVFRSVVCEEVFH
jgi:integrator complex subunit 10